MSKDCGPARSIIIRVGGGIMTIHRDTKSKGAEHARTERKVPKDKSGRGKSTASTRRVKGTVVRKASKKVV